MKLVRHKVGYSENCHSESDNFYSPIFLFSPVVSVLLLFKSHYNLVATYTLLFLLSGNCGFPLRKILSRIRHMSVEVKNFLIEICYLLALLNAVPFVSS